MTTETVIRRTALETFAVCPLRYRRMYREGGETPGRPPASRAWSESPEARRGTAFHLAMQTYIRSLVAYRRTRDADLAEDAYRRAMRVDGAQADEVAALFFPFVAEAFTLDLDAFLGCEERQTAVARYSFQPDLVYAREDRLQIIDFKTHYRAFGEREAHRAPQAHLYALFASQIWRGFEQYEVVFWFTRLNRQIPVVFDRAALEKVARYVEGLEAQLAEAIARDDFPPTPGEHCGICRYQCPVADDERRLPIRARSAEEATALAGRLLVLEQETRALTKALEGFCLTEGPVTINGVEFRHRPTVRRLWPIAPVFEFLRSNGILPDFTIPKTSLRRYLTLKKFADLKPGLDELASDVHGSWFSGQTVGADQADDEDLEESA